MPSPRTVQKEHEFSSRVLSGELVRFAGGKLPTKYGGALLVKFGGRFREEKDFLRFPGGGFTVLGIEAKVKGFAHAENKVSGKSGAD